MIYQTKHTDTIPFTVMYRFVMVTTTDVAVEVESLWKERFELSLREDKYGRPDFCRLTEEQKKRIVSVQSRFNELTKGEWTNMDQREYGGYLLKVTHIKDSLVFISPEVLASRDGR